MQEKWIKYFSSEAYQGILNFPEFTQEKINVKRGEQDSRWEEVWYCDESDVSGRLKRVVQK